MINFLKAAWNGQVKLWKVFWLLNILVSIVYGYIESLFELSPTHEKISYGIVAIYSIYSWILIWKNSWNCEWEGWGYLARIYLLLPLVLIAFLLSPVFLLPGLIIAAIWYFVQKRGGSITNE